MAASRRGKGAAGSDCSARWRCRGMCRMWAGALLLRMNASGSLDLCCGCPSPYQCEGAHCPSIPPLVGKRLDIILSSRAFFVAFFRRRPPAPCFFPSCDVAAVFAVFSSSQLPLDFVAFQCEVAFLLATFADCVRFLPSRLSKTDRPDHLGPPILI